MGPAHVDEGRGATANAVPEVALNPDAVIYSKTVGAHGARANPNERLDPSPWTRGVSEPTPPAPEDLTQLLIRAQDGDAAVRERVVQIVYGQLRAIASRQMSRQDQAHSLQPTDLVHEACLKLVGQEATWESRAHFFAVAAKAMRSILVDHARARGAQKRGGELERTPLHDAVAEFESRAFDLLALDDALEELTKMDERKARLTELRFFAGLRMEDIARVLETSLATIERDWTVTRAWLKQRVAGSA